MNNLKTIDDLMERLKMFLKPEDLGIVQSALELAESFGYSKGLDFAGEKITAIFNQTHDDKTGN